MKDYLGCIEYLRKLHNQPSFDNPGYPYWQDDIIEDEPSSNTIDKVVEALALGKIVGWCQGWRNRT